MTSAATNVSEPITRVPPATVCDLSGFPMVNSKKNLHLKGKAPWNRCPNSEIFNMTRQSYQH
jgi:hypothetical protein